MTSTCPVAADELRYDQAQSKSSLAWEKKLEIFEDAFPGSVKSGKPYFGNAIYDALSGNDATFMTECARIYSHVYEMVNDDFDSLELRNMCRDPELWIKNKIDSIEFEDDDETNLINYFIGSYGVWL